MDIEHKYREKVNRQGHSNSKKSYWAKGFETLQEFYENNQKDDVDKYKEIHNNCCGLGDPKKSLKTLKKVERKLKRKEFRKNKKSSKSEDKKMEIEKDNELSDERGRGRGRCRGFFRGRGRFMPKRGANAPRGRGNIPPRGRGRGGIVPNQGNNNDSMDEEKDDNMDIDN